jgi:hypothetical protein
VPWVLAGHAQGAWSLVEPTRVWDGRPEPGVIPAHTPIADYDTITVRFLDHAARQGWDGSIAEVEGRTRGPGAVRRRPSTFDAAATASPRTCCRCSARIH